MLLPTNCTINITGVNKFRFHANNTIKDIKIRYQNSLNEYEFSLNSEELCRWYVRYYIALFLDFDHYPEFQRECSVLEILFTFILWWKFSETSFYTLNIRIRARSGNHEILRLIHIILSETKQFSPKVFVKIFSSWTWLVKMTLLEENQSKRNTEVVSCRNTQNLSHKTTVCEMMLTHWGRGYLNCLNVRYRGF